LLLMIKILFASQGWGGLGSREANRDAGEGLRPTLVDLPCLEQCFFFSRLYLPRNELDNPHKQKTWKIYRPEFAVEVYFDEVVADT